MNPLSIVAVYSAVIRVITPGRQRKQNEQRKNYRQSAQHENTSIEFISVLTQNSVPAKKKIFFPVFLREAGLRE
jgi:hypothetical protein